MAMICEIVGLTSSLETARKHLRADRDARFKGGKIGEVKIGGKPVRVRLAALPSDIEGARGVVFVDVYPYPTSELHAVARAYCAMKRCAEADTLDEAAALMMGDE